MNKEELEIKLDILGIVRDSMIQYVCFNKTEIIDNAIAKIKAQLEILDKEEYEIEDKEVTEIISRTFYADGKPIKSSMEYKYKDK